MSKINIKLNFPFSGDKQMNLTAIFEQAEEGGFTCWIEEIPEAISQGDTIEEARSNLVDALELVLEYRREIAEKEMNKKSVYSRESIRLAFG